MREAIALLIGCLVGVLCLYILYTTQGVWDQFINSILNNPTIANFTQRDKIGGLFGNRVLQLLVVSCFSLGIYKVIRKRFVWYSPLSFGLASIFMIPAGVRLAGAFQFCYSWMLVIPLAICVCATLDEFLKISLDRWLLPSMVAGFMVLLLLVSPYTNFIDSITGWKASDYSQVEAFVQANLHSDDVVLSDPISYFAVKKNRIFVMGEPYLKVCTPTDFAEITALLIRPENLSDFQRAIGGTWVKQGESLRLKNSQREVELEIYKRG